MSAAASDLAAGVIGEVAADPRARLMAAPMSRFQWMAVAITVALCALDGFDVLAITFAAPAIAAGWGITKAGLGWVFSAGLLGMAGGSFFLAPLADVIGRRPLVLVSLAIMAVGSFVAASAGGIPLLLTARLCTGVGVGAMIATINPLGAEYANERRREVALSVLNIGYPLGGVVGGFVAALLLPHLGWRAIFLTGGVLDVTMFVVAIALLPEPLAFLLARPRPGSLARANAYLRRCGHAPVTELPPAALRQAAPTIQLFRGGMAALTLQVTAIYLLYVISMFFMQNWLPTLVTDRGYTPAQGATVSMLMSIGGIAGGLFVGAAAGRLGLKAVVVGAMLLAACFIAVFGLTPRDLLLLSVGAVVVGVALFGGMIGLYSVISRTFPVGMRASGTGLVIGIGRLGSVTSPIVAGALFTAGLAAGAVSAVMAVPALVAGILLLRFRVGAGERMTG
ncbi:MFS transporter [uncultured Sphingomonas sp.]|uniref:MFS transporter n=1 Tax=uncultured Sphingomonas sp. TaxID=158754 RepID=UPI0035CA7413